MSAVPPIAPEFVHCSDSTKSVTRRHMRCSKWRAYSITSSARMRIDAGTTRPSVLAVLRLITNSNLVGCIMGRSAGFAPLRILPAYMPTWRYASATLDGVDEKRARSLFDDACESCVDLFLTASPQDLYLKAERARCFLDSY